jgi:shikimate kinase
MTLLENINICGIKHAGKSSAANALGTLLGAPWVDSDDVLREEYNYQQSTHLSVREIYRKLGEENFRKFEAEILRKLWEYEEKSIIALGGGALNNPFLTREDLENAGMIVCIDVPDKIAYDRILKKGLPPFLQKEQDPFGAFRKMNEERRAFFQKTAHLIIHADGKSSPYTNADAIMEAYNKKWNSKG